MTARACTLLLCGALASVVTAGCTPYRIEYHQRPDFFQKASDYELPDEVEMEDGTRIVYSEPLRQSTKGNYTGPKPKRFALREELKDGTVRLQALTPEHVLINTLICLRREEYQLLWDQMLAERTKSAYAESEGGFPSFEQYMRKYRKDLGRTLTRMVAGLPHQEVAIASMGEGITRCVLRPQHAQGFKFSIVDVERDDDGMMKLLMIK
ncbi:MAG: hypothetical protein KC983_02000 [Phycisphaerales bacterium]|nr:hypothetical protein [Phycisphaerales bacterium]